MTNLLILFKEWEVMKWAPTEKLWDLRESESESEGESVISELVAWLRHMRSYFLVRRNKYLVHVVFVIFLFSKYQSLSPFLNYSLKFIIKLTDVTVQ